jgi:hypothetical protein
LGGELGTSKNDLGNFLLLNPDFFFGINGPQKAVLVIFFGVVSMALSPFFLNPRGVSVGAFSG